MTNYNRILFNRGLDSSSCSQCISLLRLLAHQGRTIICTIHQPSASLFQMFDQVYILSRGTCLYQGSTGNLIPYLADLGLPCPIYHNPADFGKIITTVLYCSVTYLKRLYKIVIELSCGDHGYDKIEKMVKAINNGKCLAWTGLSNLLPANDASSGIEINFHVVKYYNVHTSR